MEINDTLKRYLNKYKDLLCNLTRKNKEFYYKENSGTISLSNLILNNDIKNKEEYLKEFEPISLESSLLAELFENRKISLTNFFKITKYQNTTLEKKLDKLRLTDDNYQKEFGISGGWFLGPFLIWKLKSEVNEEFVTLTPIFKLAIDLKKSKNKDITLELEDAELTLNPTLKLALVKEYGIEVQEKFEDLNIQDALKQFISALEDKNINVTVNNSYKKMVTIPSRKKKIKNEDGEVIREENTDLSKALNEEEYKIYKSVSPSQFIIHDVFSLDTFNASKMSLYYDYDSIINGSDHPLISELFLGTSIPEKIDKSKLRALNEYKEKDNFFVVDIDSSQHLAIDEAKNRRALVIQGPPGTGKSQTITNMISQLLAENKKVLFVAEKRVALDVVYQRLKASELDKQTLIIHNSELNRKELYNSFVEYKNEEYEKSIEDSWSKLTTELDYTKNKISSYALELKEIDSKSGLLKSDVFTMYADYVDFPYSQVVAKYFQNVSNDNVDLLIKEIVNLHTISKSIYNLKENFWLFKSPKFHSNDASKSLLNELLSEVKEIVNGLKANYSNALFIYNLQELKYELDEIDFEANDDLELVHYFLLGLLNTENFTIKLNQTILSLEEMKPLLDSYLLFVESTDLIFMKNCNEYFSKKRGFFDWFSPKYWELKKQLKLNSKVPIEKLTLNKEISQWIKFYELSEEVKSQFKEVGYPKKLNDKIVKIESINDLIHSIQISVSFYKNLNKLMSKDILKSYLDSNFTKYKNDYINYSKLLKSIKAESEKLQANFKKLSDFSAKRIEYDFNRLNLELLEDVLQIFNKAIEDFKFAGDIEKLDYQIIQIENFFNISKLKDVYLDYLLNIEEPHEFIKAQIVKVWHENILESSQTIKYFNSDVHHNQLNNFSDLINQHRFIAKKTVSNNLAKIKQSTRSINPSSVSKISREASKQRRIKSPRELMEDGCLETMLSIKRCWLMSPLSISQILPNVKELFDVVIFDEASQVKVEDAIPAIYRGKSLIVVGDKNQMPPTNFFSGGGDNDDDEDDIEIGESILDQALRNYPDVLLEWHYRSQSEALIAFSNYAFYGGRLIAPPNPNTFTKNKPIEFVKVTDGTFNSKEGNVVEARLVVSEIVKILNADPSSSIGVISMGVSQQKVIEKLLDEEVEKNKEFATNYEKSLSHREEGAFVGFFNKNLENVQGDERDHIIISVGYAPATVGGKLRQAFGPLSQKGGGRRLNVAITRAKKSIKIFCSFDPSSLEIGAEAFSTSPEKTCFARYLNYAKAISDGREDSAKNILNMFPVSGVVSGRKSSRFNLDVKRELVKLGYKVDSEVGACGFYIDLAVEHPNIEHTYMLGIECDGAIFHSSDYARDRDKARQSLLEKRGWKIHRIWSQDWSKNRNMEIEKIIQIIKELSN